MMSIYLPDRSKSERSQSLITELETLIKVQKIESWESKG